MKILITGGAGFIGSHVADRFSASDEVHVIDNLSTGLEENISEQINFHNLDIRSVEAANLIRELQPDVICHAAAQMSVRESMSKPTYDIDVNVCGLVNILNALPAEKLPFFIFLSTGGAIYGNQEDLPSKENSSLQPISVYGTSKLAGEEYLKLWQRVFGLKVAILRLANVYGPRQNPHGEAGVVAIFCNALLNSGAIKFFGAGENTRDYIFVGDVVNAIDMAARQKISGIFNIGTGIETSVCKLYAELVKHSQNKIEPEICPARLGEQLRSCIDPSFAKEKLGWQAAVSLEKGLYETLSWAQEHLNK